MLLLQGLANCNLTSDFKYLTIISFPFTKAIPRYSLQYWELNCSNYLFAHQVTSECPKQLHYFHWKQQEEVTCCWKWYQKAKLFFPTARSYEQITPQGNKCFYFPVITPDTRSHPTMQSSFSDTAVKSARNVTTRRSCFYAKLLS